MISQGQRSAMHDLAESAQRHALTLRHPYALALRHAPPMDEPHARPQREPTHKLLLLPKDTTTAASPCAPDQVGDGCGERRLWRLLPLVVHRPGPPRLLHCPLLRRPHALEVATLTLASRRPASAAQCPSAMATAATELRQVDVAAISQYF
jgi:hypothetical protein